MKLEQTSRLKPGNNDEEDIYNHLITGILRIYRSDLVIAIISYPVPRHSFNTSHHSSSPTHRPNVPFVADDLRFRRQQFFCKNVKIPYKFSFFFFTFSELQRSLSIKLVFILLLPIFISTLPPLVLFSQAQILLPQSKIL